MVTVEPENKRVWKGQAMKKWLQFIVTLSLLQQRQIKRQKKTRIKEGTSAENDDKTFVNFEFSQKTKLCYLKLCQFFQKKKRKKMKTVVATLGMGQLPAIICMAYFMPMNIHKRQLAQAWNIPWGTWSPQCSQRDDIFKGTVPRSINIIQQMILISAREFCHYPRKLTCFRIHVQYINKLA